MAPVRTVVPTRVKADLSLLRLACPRPQRRRATTMSAPPTPEDVGAMYDALTDLLSQALGDNIHAGYWQDAQDTSNVAQAADRLTGLVGQRLRAGAGQHVLDVGCGSGRPAVRIAAASGSRVTGITVSGHQLSLARARPETSAADGMLEFRQADAMQLPFPDASFDAAYAIESLLHMSDQRTALAHLARVLRPGGRLVVADLCLSAVPHGADADAVAAASQVFQVSSIASPDEYRTLLEEAGFKVEECSDIAPHVRRTYAVVARTMRQAGESIGGELAVQLDGAAASVERFGTLDCIGYALVTAVRP
ncbi:methyltransferase domain-containing protein [Streptomyces spectabilis]|uniref:Methyltransferase domain-containing protein n=2 Tax=Streptomyces spectabilis TaxID=68270 RepID=A0A516R715_STRST|nr:methyltransferase domain-containing protein [Streptomyces spectabilis]